MKVRTRLRSLSIPKLLDPPSCLVIDLTSVRHRTFTFCDPTVWSSLPCRLLSATTNSHTNMFDSDWKLVFSGSDDHHSAAPLWPLYEFGYVRKLPYLLRYIHHTNETSHKTASITTMDNFVIIWVCDNTKSFARRRMSNESKAESRV